MHPELFLDVYRENAREVDTRLRHHLAANQRVASPSRVASWVTTTVAGLRSARAATPAAACCPA